MSDVVGFLETPRLRAPQLRGWTSDPADSALTGEPAGQVEELRALEELVCAAQARQTRLAAALDQSTPGRGVAAQIALARRESPHRGRQHLSLARIAHELPCAAEAFRRGLVTEWRMMTLARETACLTLADRLTIDRALAGDPDAFSGYSERTVITETRKLAAKLDPAAIAAHRRHAETERRVTLRPAPDTMTYLTALLPVAAGVAVHAALAAAETARAAGDPRSRGQLMADTLITRITGAPTARDGEPVVPVTIGVVMSDQALLHGAHDDAAITDHHGTGHRPIPADLARALVLANLDTRTRKQARTWLRRLYTHPETGQLVAMDSHRRLFPAALAMFLRHRDQWCRTPWCNAPIRHTDHITPAAHGGATTAANGQGLCEACNHDKQAPGWHHQPRPGPTEPDGHTVEITTPTGHHYQSTAPPLLRARRGAYHEATPGHWILIA